MKFRKSLLCVFTSGALLFGSALLAQDTPPPPPPPPAPAAPVPPPPPPPSAAADASPDAVQLQSPKGEVVIQSVPSKVPTMGPPPSFEQLAAGGKSISESQAEAYPPLANDFINADRNRDGHISKAEYQRWVKQF